MKKTFNKYGGAKESQCIKINKLWNPNTGRCVGDNKLNRKKGARTPVDIEVRNEPVEPVASVSISEGDKVKWTDKTGKVLEGKVKNKTMKNYIICCKKDNSTWRVPIDWPSLTKK